MGDIYNDKVVVAALMGDRLFDYISNHKRTRNEENISLDNYSNIDLDAVRQIAQTKIIDLAIIDFDLYQVESERHKLEVLFEYGALDEQGSLTRFVMIYNEENEGELIELNRTLLKRNIPMSNVDLDDKEDELDKTLLVHNILADIQRIKDQKAIFASRRKEIKSFFDKNDPPGSDRHSL